MCLFICVDANPQMFANIGALVTSVKNFSAICDIAIGLLKGFSPNLHLVGHLGDLHLTAATLANSSGTVIGFALMVGLSGALETLCSLAYGAMLYKIAHTHLASPGALSGKYGRLLSPVLDPRPLRLCTPTVHAEGVALSASVSIWISFVMLAIYVKYSNKFRYTWKGFTVEALRHS
ncbi:hypothetical protein ZIOFF_020829 [Zingiber officinale]|uniref:Nodulin-like domain-containing protein n=1 Tax=Zingiber officinale TaxID=94328 RepID=A0A8J5HAK8_ZINOF|nr:hypothetical protein ZIOFF_020829 [Zingiber officinale]